MARARVTARCESKDLADLPADVAIAILDKFEQVCSIKPESGKRILELTDRRCYAHPLGRYRFATWHDVQRDVVWLVAAGVRRQDDVDDFYEVLLPIWQAGELYPTAADYALLEAELQVERRRGEARALADLRASVLDRPDGSRHTYVSPDGLYVEMWAEAIPGLRLLALRIRLLRLHGPFLTDSELATLLAAALSRNHVEKPDPEGDWRFRYFEDYVAVPEG